jgi:uncharacterized protein
MKEFIEYLVKSVVTKPESVEITETKQEGGMDYLIKVADEDMGIIIGKEGKTIKSIRNLVKAKAIKDNVRIRIDLEEHA